MTLRDRLSQRLESSGLALAPSRFESLWSYVELLVKWNRRINLTAFEFDADVDAAIDRLVLEPIAAARIAKSALRVLDVGSGGGSPAIPFFLGLADPSELVMVESRAKKAVFLREALRSVGIVGRVAAERFEQLVTPEPFDAVTVRAVAADEPLWALIRRTLAVDGRLFWFHSRLQPQPEQEVVSWDEPVGLLGGESRLSVGRRV